MSANIVKATTKRVQLRRLFFCCGFFVLLRHLLCFLVSVVLGFFSFLRFIGVTFGCFLLACGVCCLLMGWSLWPMFRWVFFFFAIDIPLVVGLCYNFFFDI